MARAFGLAVMQRTRCEKCEKEGKARITLKEFENASAFLNPTESEDMVVYQDDHTLHLLRWALLLSLVFIILNADFTALRLHLRSVFSVFAPGSSSFFFAPITTFAI